MSNIVFPPPGFVKTTSKVEGIEVFAPAKKSEDHPEVVDFKCPKCGGSIAFDPQAQKLACPYCGYTQEQETTLLGRSAEQFEFKVETLQQSERGWGVQRKDMACQDCGALVSVPPDTLSYACPFCGSNKVLFREAMQDGLRPRYLVPFKVNPAACRQITQGWLGSSWMIPSQLKSAARVDQFTPVFVPYWTFTALCKATWKAQVGKEVEERYFENGEWHTRTRIEWHWESGRVDKAFQDLLVPGTSRLNLTAMGKIDFYNIGDLVLYEPGLLAGIQAQAYDITLEQAWDAGRDVMRERTRQACMDKPSTSHVRDFSMSLDFCDESWRYILVPVYTSVYSYAQKTYQVLINGQTGKIAGPRPVDWRKVWLAIGGALAPGAILGLIGLLTLLLQIGVVIGGIGLVLFIVGLVIAFIIFFKAQEMEHVGNNPANPIH